MDQCRETETLRLLLLFFLEKQEENSGPQNPQWVSQNKTCRECRHDLHRRDTYSTHKAHIPVYRHPIRKNTRKHFGLQRYENQMAANSHRYNALWATHVCSMLINHAISWAELVGAPNCEQGQGRYDGEKPRVAACDEFWPIYKV